MIAKFKAGMTQEAMRAALGAHKDVFYQSKKRKSASTTPSVPNAAFVPPEGMSRNGVSTYTRETQAGGSGERIHVMPATVNEARNDGHDDDVFSGQMPRPPQPLPSSGDLVKDKFVKVFARMAYFMRSEQGYFGCSIVGFCKGVKFFFARVFWYGSKSMAAKALRGYMTVLEYEEVRVSTPDTTNLSSKWQRVKEAYQQMKQDTLLKLAAKVKPKPSEDQNTPQKIIVNVWDFFHKEYGAALVLLDQDGYMATVKDQDVTSALKRIGEELKPEGTVSFGTYSRRAPIDELLKGLRLPEMGASWDNWQLFAYERSDQACVTAATLRGGNVTDGHMQFPRMHGIVTQLNQDASGETVSDDVRHHFFPFSLADLFSGESEQGAMRVKPVRAGHTAAGMVNDWRESKQNDKRDAGMLQQIQDIFANELAYCGLSFEGLVSKHNELSLGKPLREFFTMLWCWRQALVVPENPNTLNALQGQFWHQIQDSGDGIEYDAIDSFMAMVEAANTAEKRELVTEAYAYATEEDEAGEDDAFKDVPENLPAGVAGQRREELGAWLKENSSKGLPNLKMLWDKAKGYLLKHVADIAPEVHSVNGPSSNSDKLLHLLAALWEDYKTQPEHLKETPYKLVVCGDDGRSILNNTAQLLEAIKEHAPQLIPPHVKAIRLCEFDLFGQSKVNIEDTLAFPVSIDMSKHSDERLAFAREVDLMGMTLFMEKCIEVIEANGNAGWKDARVTNPQKRREYVTCKRKNNGNTIAHDAGGVTYHHDDIETFAKALVNTFGLDPIVAADENVVDAPGFSPDGTVSI